MAQIDNKKEKSVSSSEHKERRGRPLMREEKLVRVQVMMTPANAKKIKSIASILGLSMSSFICQSLDVYLNIPQNSKKHE